MYSYYINLYQSTAPKISIHSSFACCLRHGTPGAVPGASRPGSVAIASRVWSRAARLGIFPLTLGGLVCLPIAVDKSKFRTCELKPQIFRLFQNAHAQMWQIKKG